MVGVAREEGTDSAVDSDVTLERLVREEEGGRNRGRKEGQGGEKVRRRED